MSEEDVKPNSKPRSLSGNLRKSFSENKKKSDSSEDE